MWGFSAAECKHRALAQPDRSLKPDTYHLCIVFSPQRKKTLEQISVFCEDKTIEMFLRFRCLDLNTRHNHSTSLRFCFQGCLQRNFDFRAADKDHLDFLF